MAQNSPPSTTSKNILTSKVAGMPLWTWGLIVVAGVGIGLFFLNRNKQQAVQPATSPSAQAVQDTTASSEQVPNTTGDQVFVVAPPTPVTGGTGTNNPPGSGTGSAPQTYTIRQPGKAPDFDNKNAGVPFWSSPGSSEIGELPWGSSVTSNGIPVVGPSNTGQANGDTIWYPVTFNGQSGYVSRFDLIGVGSGGPRQPRYTSNSLSAIGEYNG